MQIKSIADTDFLSTVYMLEHAAPEDRLVLQGHLVALVDMHVREQIQEVESRRADALDRRQLYGKFTAESKH